MADVTEGEAVSSADGSTESAPCLHVDSPVCSVQEGETATLVVRVSGGQPTDLCWWVPQLRAASERRARLIGGLVGTIPVCIRERSSRRRLAPPILGTCAVCITAACRLKLSSPHSGVRFYWALHAP